MKKIGKPWTRKELLLALLIITVVYIIPSGSYAAPAEKARADSAVTQVKNTLRQITEVTTLWEKAGGCSKEDCMDMDKLIASGKLSGAPQVPPGINVGDTSPVYGFTERSIGGCGPLNRGAPITINPSLENVSEQFCRSYNNAVGLGSIIVENCASGGKCVTSGSVDPYDFPVVNSSSLCYRRLDVYAVVWMSTLYWAPCHGQ